MAFVQFYTPLRIGKFVTPLVIPINKNAKNLSYESIPRSPHVPVLGSLPYILKSGGPKLFHIYIDDLHKRLGPIFVDKIRGSDFIFISDPEANFEIFRTEGPHPKHFVPEAWLIYLKKTKKERGLFFMDGPEWLQYRKIFNKVMLKPANAEAHFKVISSISEDLMKAWKKKAPGKDLQYHLYNWSIECIGGVAFGTRLNFIEKLISSDQAPHSTHDDIVKSIYDILIESNLLTMVPLNLAERFNTKTWRRFYTAVSKALSYGEFYVNEALEQCSKEMDDNGKNSLVYKLYVEEKLEKSIVSKLIIDLFLASADTTSHAAIWALYLLGRNPEKARIAREEVERLSKQEGGLTIEALRNMSYIKAIIKETLRLYPIATFINRITVKDISLNGYDVPSGSIVSTSIYTMGRDPNHFTDPCSFKPERWIRSNQLKESCPKADFENSTQHNQRAYAPWGLGARSCVGKRIAEIELALLLAQALTSFDWTVENEIKMIMQMISVPETDVLLQLQNRI